MRSKAISKRNSSVSKVFATALPFDSALVRYAVCLCLAASAGCALWAYLVIQPATRSLMIEGGHLLDLEQRWMSAQSASADLELFKSQADAARARIFPRKESVDSSIVALVEDIKSRGWSAVLAASDHDERPNALLARSSYQLELSRESKPDSPSEINDLTTAQLLGILASVQSAPGALDIERLEILSHESRSTKAFVTLVAHVAKTK